MSNAIDLAEVNISVAAGAAWQEFAERVARALAATNFAGVIPDEQGRVEEDGSLTVFVHLPNGVEMSMNVPEGHWQWARRQ